MSSHLDRTRSTKDLLYLYIESISLCFKELMMRAGRESLLCLQQNKPSRVVYVFFGLTVFCAFCDYIAAIVHKLRTL